MVKIYDEQCPWPYHQPYGMVPAPKVLRKQRKPRKSRAMPQWLKEQRKRERTQRVYTCTCKRGVQRDNCPQCEGTGMAIDFKAMRAQTQQSLGQDHVNRGHGAKPGEKTDYSSDIPFNPKE